MMKVLLIQPLPAPVFDILQTALAGKAQVQMLSSIDETEFARAAATAEVLINGFGKLTARMLALAPKVRFVQQLGVGYDNLDLEAIRHAGILVANAPGVNTEAVAEHTVMLMLTWLKKFSQAEQAARANKWATLTLTQAGIGDLATATVGLIGFGAIGQAVAERLRGFGPRLLYTARHRAALSIEEKSGVVYVSFAELLATARVVSLHLPLAEETRHMMGAKELAQMQAGVVLINTSRGALVDETALLQALESGQIGGAALDVLEHEADGGNPFTNLPQVIVTPHTAGLSQAATNKLFQIAFGNVVRYVIGQPPQYLIS